MIGGASRHDAAERGGSSRRVDAHVDDLGAGEAGEHRGDHRVGAGVVDQPVAGGSRRLGDGRRAASRATATIQRRPVHSSSLRDSSPARPAAASSVQRELDLAVLEADDADRVLERMLQLEVALLAGKRDEIGEACRAAAVGCGAGAATARPRRGARRAAAPPPAGGKARPPSPPVGRDDGAGAARARGRRAVAERAQRLVGRRQVGGVGEADEHHVGGGERLRRLAWPPRCP